MTPYAAGVQRLTSDPRMRTVWKELLGRHRSGARRGEYYHPAIQESVQTHRLFTEISEYTNHSPSRDRLQHQALAMLFADAAMQCSWLGSPSPPGTRTKRELSREAAQLKQIAVGLRKAESTLREMGYMRLAYPVHPIVDDCLQYVASLEEARDDFVVKRRSNRLGGAHVQGFGSS